MEKNTQPKNCYFYVEGETEESKMIRAMCVECRTQKYPDTGWFYDGSKQGYGPFDYKCAKCKGVIHKQTEDN